MKNKIVWVFGCSASGKETFIKSMVFKKDFEIIKQLGWSAFKMIKIDESINYIKQSEDDVIGFKRVEIIDRVIEENKKNEKTIILIKGQNIDFDNHLVEILKSKLADVEHEIIFLISDIKTVFERVREKKWFSKEDDDINYWIEHMKETEEYVKALKNTKITTIDSTNDWKIIL